MNTAVACSAFASGRIISPVRIQPNCQPPLDAPPQSSADIWRLSCGDGEDTVFLSYPDGLRTGNPASQQPAEATAPVGCSRQWAAHTSARGSFCRGAEHFAGASAVIARSLATSPEPQQFRLAAAAPGQPGQRVSTTS
jgi:hypothetical protein